MSKYSNTSIELFFIRVIEKNIIDIKLFFIVFFINIVIFGQKIFFYSLATDDYLRFYGKDNGFYLARVSGRWAQDILNNYIFIEKLHILPYFHGLLGVLSFTFVGYLTAKYLKRNNAIEILIVTLLISASPMFAHNLYFNTNITAWLTTALGVVGFLMMYKQSFYIKIIGFCFLVFAIGSYQTIVQVIIAMIVFKVILDLLQIKYGKEIIKIIFNAWLLILFTGLAYAVSVGINEYIIDYYCLVEGGRYQYASNITSLSIYIDRLVNVYKTYISLNYFSEQLITMYKIMAILSFIGIVSSIIKMKIKWYIKSFVFILILILFLAIPIVINLPLLMGTSIPTRAHYTMGWILAGLFTIQMISFRENFKVLPILLTTLIIVVSIYYINIFFDAAKRQTNLDIIRMNQIVNRIRMHPNYNREPIKFKIIGLKSFPAIGWKSYQQALNTDWSIYGAFRNFTDLKFTKMNNNEYEEVINYLIKKRKIVNIYPEKNSIIVYENKVLLILKSTNINTRIMFKQLPKRLPDIKAKFNLYITTKGIFYQKPHCNSIDIKDRFFLHIYPKASSNGSLNYQFKNMDFNFYEKGKLQYNKCVAYIELPKFNIHKIQTGQYRGYNRFWDITYVYPQE